MGVLCIIWGAFRMIITITIEEETENGITVFTKEIDVIGNFGKACCDADGFLNNLNEAICAEVDQEDYDLYSNDEMEKVCAKLKPFQYGPGVGKICRIKPINRGAFCAGED